MKLVASNDPVLHTVCRPVSADEFPALQASLAEFIEVMKAAGGLGLAGPQVGDARRFFVYKVADVYKVVINPEIIARDHRKTVEEEGCLSYPGLRVGVKRSNRVRVRYQTIDELITRVTLNERDSRVFQHEFDHLDGITIG